MKHRLLKKKQANISNTIYECVPGLPGEICEEIALYLESHTPMYFYTRNFGDEEKFNDKITHTKTTAFGSESPMWRFFTTTPVLRGESKWLVLKHNTTVVYFMIGWNTLPCSHDDQGRGHQVSRYGHDSRVYSHKGGKGGFAGHWTKEGWHSCFGANKYPKGMLIGVHYDRTHIDGYPRITFYHGIEGNTLFKRKEMEPIYEKIPDSGTILYEVTTWKDVPQLSKEYLVYGKGALHPSLGIFQRDEWEIVDIDQSDLAFVNYDLKKAMKLVNFASAYESQDEWLEKHPHYQKKAMPQKL